MYNENTPPIVGNSQVPQVQMPQVIPPIANAVNPYMAPQPVVHKKPRRKYSIKESIYAWLCYILAYLFVLTVPIRENSLGLLVVVVLMYALSTVFTVSKGKKLQAMPIVVGVSALVVSLGFVLNVSGFLRFFSFIYVMTAYCYYIYAMTSENRFRFCDSILIDFIKAIFVLPFYSLADMFVSMFEGAKNKGGKTILKVVIGFGLAVIPTAIVLSLLSYDSDFSKLMDTIFHIEDFNLLTHLVKLFLALPLGAYAYGIYISSFDKKCDKILTTASCKKSMTKMRIAPAVTVVTAVLPVLFVYVVFFISQWKYYVSGFTGVLPKGFSYAEYAREGFFQLCTVSVINLVMLTAVSLFLKRKEGKSSVLLKILAIVFSLFTLVLISTAVAKMMMYIDCYGLTPKRVYSTWLMLVLALIFVLIILKQFIGRLRLIALSLAVMVLMFSALTLSGVEKFIAEYNVNRYIDGTLPIVDVDALTDLNDASIASQVRLYHHITDEIMSDSYNSLSAEEKEMYDEVILSLKRKATFMVEDKVSVNENIWSFTVPASEAEKALTTTPFYGNSYAEELGFYWF